MWSFCWKLHISWGLGFLVITGKSEDVSIVSLCLGLIFSLLLPFFPCASVWSWSFFFAFQVLFEAPTTVSIRVSVWGLSFFVASIVSFEIQVPKTGRPFDLQPSEDADSFFPMEIHPKSGRALFFPMEIHRTSGTQRRARSARFQQCGCGLRANDRPSQRTLRSTSPPLKTSPELAPLFPFCFFGVPFVFH